MSETETKTVRGSDNLRAFFKEESFHCIVSCNYTVNESKRALVLVVVVLTVLRKLVSETETERAFFKGGFLKKGRSTVLSVVTIQSMKVKEHW